MLYLVPLLHTRTSITCPYGSTARHQGLASPIKQHLDLGGLAQTDI